MPLPSVRVNRLGIGQSGESLAASHLISLGWHLLARNLRVGRDEIDLLCRDGETIVVVEVRARKLTAAVHAAESITPAKTRRLRRAALRLASEQDIRELRIDVVSVDGDAVELIRNAVDFTST